MALGQPNRMARVLVAHSRGALQLLKPPQAPLARSPRISRRIWPGPHLQIRSARKTFLRLLETSLVELAHWLSFPPQKVNELTRFHCQRFRPGRQ